MFQVSRICFKHLLKNNWEALVYVKQSKFAGMMFAHMFLVHIFYSGRSWIFPAGKEDCLF